MSGMQLRRLGIVMEPEPDNDLEAEGVLNPAAVRGQDGALYLFPRLVAKGNYSRIGIARVKFNSAGDPIGVERLGIALEPQEEYELREDGSGGCEDPRVTFFESLQMYVMAYAAHSPQGPRIALAISKDLFHWQRLGLACFEPENGIEFNNLDNKDASIFPVEIPNPSGELELGMLHRPLFPGTRPEETARKPGKRTLNLHCESIWISYGKITQTIGESYTLGTFTSHHRLASPVSPWERLKIGGGTPPIATLHGWLVAYHGVSENLTTDGEHPKLCYSAGIMLLDKEHPRTVRYRSKEPVLVPTQPEERIGTVGNVVFPTGIDQRLDLDPASIFDIYYGMADNQIGAARLHLPEILPSGAPADHPKAEV
jgi:predicted GH43/DUF377 family glycosyl hydrolase